LTKVERLESVFYLNIDLDWLKGSQSW